MRAAYPVRVASPGPEGRYSGLGRLSGREAKDNIAPFPVTRRIYFRGSMAAEASARRVFPHELVNCFQLICVGMSPAFELRVIPQLSRESWGCLFRHYPVGHSLPRSGRGRLSANLAAGSRSFEYRPL